MPTELNVLLIGTASLDIVGRLDTDIQIATSNPAHIRTSFGGVARNVAENLARLGQMTTLITAVGEDTIGEDILAYTAKAGVEITPTIRANGLPSGFYFAALDNQGVLSFAVDDMRVINTITPKIISEKINIFESAALIFVDGNLSEATLKTIFSLSKKFRIPVCADPASVRLANKFTPYLGKIKIITPNSLEAASFIGHPFDPADQQASMEAARILVSRGVDIAIITLAEFGVSYATSETTGYISAIHTKILDPTGAGDALTAAVIFGLLNDIPLDDALRLGVSAASLTLRYPGTVDPDLSLERLYDQLIV